MSVFEGGGAQPPAPVVDSIGDGGNERMPREEPPSWPFYVGALVLWVIAVGISIKSSGLYTGETSAEDQQSMARNQAILSTSMLIAVWAGAAAFAAALYSTIQARRARWRWLHALDD